MGEADESNERKLMIRGFVIIGVLIALVAVGAWFLVPPAWDESPEVVLALVSVLATYIINQLLQRRVERQRIVELRREKVGPIFEEFFIMMRRLVRADKSQLGPEDEKVLTDIQDRLIVWGSKDVIQAWAQFMAGVQATPKDFGQHYVAFLRVLRSELGHDDSGLSVRDLLSLNISDVDELVPPNARL